MKLCLEECRRRLRRSILPGGVGNIDINSWKGQYENEFT